MEMLPMIIKNSIFTCQACVPEHWTDTQIVEFVENRQPSGTENGWMVLKDGDPRLQGDAGRGKCAERAGFIHVVLEV